MTEEVWKDIEGYEGFYQVSNLGRVKSLLNRFPNTKGICIMKEEIIPKGYKRVYLSKPYRKRFLVHRLVAKAFIPNPDNKPDINHIDNNPSNNTATNLEWCNQSENLLHAQKQHRLFAAQHKGGINQSRLAAQKAEENAKRLVGQTINEWTVLEHIGLKPIGQKGVFRQFVKCKCSCGTIQDVEALRLLNRKATRCRKCCH